MPRQKPKFWQTQKFKDLQKIWEERLKKSGFIDIELKGMMRPNPYDSCKISNQTVADNKLRYFELLGHGYHDETFTDEVEDYVMKRRIEGVSSRQIGKELKEKNQKNSRETIRKIIRFYEKKWQVKAKKKKP